ncbi:MAG: endonuclease/exonuclease/phosphatase family protein, partial [Planctomycetes bacterium]|nr:endonuclease/exonuclease/phosphatase family protein [Planctomycetota bacterium]
LRDYPFRCVRTAEGPFGVALLSRLPLTDATVVPLGFAWSPAVRATLTTAAGPIGVLGVHPPRPGGRSRNAERDRGLAALPGLLTGLPSRHLVIGDCNATPFNPSFRAMLAEAGLQNAARARWLPSWPQQLPWPLRVPIDHVLVSTTVQVAEIDTGPTFGSDHAPIFAVLTW